MRQIASTEEELVRKILVALMGSLALALAACGGSSNNNEKVVDVHPELVFVDYVSPSKDGKRACTEDVATYPLTIDGTVSINGTAVAVNTTEQGATMTFVGPNPSVSAIVNDTHAFPLPAGEEGKTLKLNLAKNDFGKVSKAVLCGGAA